LNPQFIDAEGKKRSFSNIEAELWWYLDPYLSAYLDAELNPYRGSFDIFNFSIVARDRRNDVVAVTYQNTRSTLSTFKEINLIARVKTISPIYLFGAFYYNLLAGTWVQGIFGAEYQTQCWSAGFVLEGINQSPDGTQKKDVKFHVYLILLNLGSVGSRPYFMGL
jgi:lipopolysaccharide assembly outer membrane protein LptD (OstA)